MLEQINFIESQLNELEVQITTMLFEENQVITTIPGIGNVLRAIIIGEIGDISRFDSAPKLVVFAGLDVSVKQSGWNLAALKTKSLKEVRPILEELYLDCCQPYCFL